MRTIFLSAGHSNTPGRDRGACANGHIEGNLTVELRELVKTQLLHIGVVALSDGNNSVTADTVAFLRKKAPDPKSLLVDFHFNAGPPAATGTETVIPDTSSAFERELADELCAYIAQTLQIRNRGRKTEGQSARGKLAWMRPAGENILPEICFISNREDMQKYEAQKHELAAGIARILKKWAAKP